MKKVAAWFACFALVASSGWAQPSNCVPPPSGLVLWLPFDETSGSRTANLAPGGNTGVITNSVTRSPGYVSGGLCFTGIQNEYAYVPDYPGINPGTGDFTLDAWVKGSYGGSTPRILLDKRNPVTGIGYSFRARLNKLELQLADASGATDFIDTVNIGATGGPWHFVAVTVNRNSTNGGRFYVDGVLTSTFDPTTRPGSLNNTNVFRIDSSPVDGFPFQGCMDEVEMFNRALTTNEIQDIYQAGYLGKCKPPIAFSNLPPATASYQCLSNVPAPPTVAATTWCQGGTNVHVGYAEVQSNPGSSCSNVIMRSWAAVDNCGNVTNYFQFITVNNDTPPVLTCASNKAVECGSGWSFDPPTATDVCNGTNVSITVLVLDTVTTGVCPQLITRTWLVTDCAGNTNTCSQTVNVVDTTPPMLTCANNKPVECGTVWSFDPPTAYDSCDPNPPAIAVVSTVTNGLCPLVITRTWVATDQCGNSNTCSQTVAVSGIVLPGMTLWLPFDETNGTSSVNLAGGNNGTRVNAPTVNLGGFFGNSLCFDGNDGYVEVPSYSAINFGSNNFSISVWVRRPAYDSGVQSILDKRGASPSFTGYHLFLYSGTLAFQLADGTYDSYISTLYVPNDSQWHHVAVTVDRISLTGIRFYLDGVVDAVPRNPVAHPGSVNTASPLLVGGHSFNTFPFDGCIDEVGLYDRVLSPGEITSLYNTVSAPLVTVVVSCSSNKTVECSSVWNFDPPAAFDLCSGSDATITILDTVTNGLCPQAITRTWLATDACGNTNTCSQAVTVVDTAPPLLTCASNKTVVCGSSWSFDGPAAVDACSGTNVAITTLSTETNGLCPQLITRTWLASDACGNTNTCSQTVTVISCVPPSCLVGWWPGDGNANDLIGGHHGTLENGATANASGEVGQAFQFDGADDYVKVPHHADLSLGNNFTIELWLYQSAANPAYGHVLVGKETGGLADGYHLDTFDYFQTGRRLRICMQACYQASTVYSLNAWHHAAVTYNQGTLTFYLDGVPDGSYSGVAAPPANNLDLFIGAGHDGSGALSTQSFFQGKLDEVSLYNCALSSNQIAAIFAAGPAGKCTTPALVCATNKIVSCGDVWSFDPPVVNAPCNATNLETFVISTVTNGVCPMFTTRTWLFVDACGNTNTCTQTVTVVDATPPVLICVSNKTVQLNVCSFEPGQGFTVLKNFTGSDGAFPYAGLVAGSDGALYGTTAHGGSSTHGTVFKLSTNGGGNYTVHTVLKSFIGSDGRAPVAGLLAGSDGALYGTTANGGSSDFGTVFKMSTNSSGNYTIHTVLKNFSGSDGANPGSGLVEGSDGALYGTTSGGGSTNYGTVFKLSKDGSGNYTIHTVLKNFTGSSDGANPASGPVEGSDGALYGTTARDISNGYGTVFKMSKDGTGNYTVHTVLKSFTGSDGANPYAGLVEGSDGALYGTTSSGPSGGVGTVFKLSKDGTGNYSVHTVLKSFNYNDGAYSYAALVEGLDGALYGTTQGGGSGGGYGTVFRIGCVSSTGWSFDAPTAVDDCSGTNVAITIVSTVTNSGPCPLIVARTWLATDLCDNSNTCSQTVTVVDGTLPVITVCPTNIVICSSNGCGAMPNITNLVQATDNSGVVHISQSIPAGTTLCSNTVVTLTVTDDCGNQATCTAPVTVGSATALITGYALAVDGFHIQFATQSGFSYTVEYTDSLFPATWLPLTTVFGDGTSREAVDSGALANTRFYRLRRLCP